MHFIRNSLFSHLISFLIIGGLLHYLINHWHSFYTNLVLSFNELVYLVILIIITWILGSMQTIILMREVKIHVGFFEGIFTLVAMALGNYLPMRIGTLIRMHYFKTIHNLEYSIFGGMYSARTLIMLASTGVLGCLGMAGIGCSLSKYALILFGIYFCLIIFSIGMYFLPLPKSSKNAGFFLKIWSNFLLGYATIRKSKRFFIQMFILLLLQYFVLAFRLYISFHAIGENLTPFAYLVIAPSTVLISIFSFTPGNLGLREWLIGILTFSIGIDFDSGIFAGTIDRILLIICTFIFGIISLFYLKSRIKYHYQYF